MVRRHHACPHKHARVYIVLSANDFEDRKKKHTHNEFFPCICLRHAHRAVEELFLLLGYVLGRALRQALPAAALASPRVPERVAVRVNAVARRARAAAGRG
jgi:ribosomal protein L19